MALANNAAEGSSREKGGKYRNLFKKAVPSPPRLMRRNELVSRLSQFGKMGESLLKLMGIPEKLHYLGDGRFSSDPKTPAFLVTYPQFVDELDTSKFAEYSIAIGSRGSNVFCTLIDRKRNILVSDSIKNMYVAEGNWMFFQARLESALEAAKSLSPEQKKDGVLVTRVS